MVSSKRLHGGVDSRESWLMAVGSSLCFFVSMGFTRADGVMFVALMQQMPEGTTRETASWPFNLAGASVIFMAPITGFLCSRFSPMSLAFCGTTLFATGMAACYFSTNIVYLSLCLGLIKGSGQAIMITIVPMLVNHSFQRYRGTAMGLATTGTALGGFILPLLVQLLLEMYGLQGTFLLLGGIALHGLLGAATYIFYQRHPEPEIMGKQNIPEKEHLRGSKENSTGAPTDEGDEQVSNEKSSLICKSEHSHTERIYGSVEELEATKMTHDDKSSLPSPSPATKQPSNSSMYSLHLMKRVLSSRGFYFVAINQIISLQLVEMFSLVVVDYSVDRGIDHTNAVLLVTISSGCEIFGRLALGWITDRKYLRRPTYMMLCQSLSAALLFLFSFFSQYYLLGVIAGLLGMIQGSVLSVTHVTFTDYLRREEIALGVSFARSFHGLASVARSPIIGFFRDQLGSYDLLFRSVAAVSLGVGVMWFAESLYLYITQRKGKAQRVSV